MRKKQDIRHMTSACLGAKGYPRAYHMPGTVAASLSGLSVFSSVFLWCGELSLPSPR